MRRHFAADVVGLMVPFEESADAQWLKTILWEMLRTELIIQWVEANELWRVQNPVAWSEAQKLGRITFSLT